MNASPIRTFARLCLVLLFLGVLLLGLSRQIAPGLGSSIVGAQSDSGLPQVEFDSAFFAINEGDTVTIRVELDSLPATSASVEYLTVDGTAEDGDDYDGVEGVLTFNSSTTLLTFTIDTLEDSISEPTETVNLILRNPVNAELGTTSTAVLSILDDDPTPTATSNAQATSTPIFLDTYEPNNDFDEAYTVAANAAATCNISLWPVGDVDFFRFNAKSGKAYEILTQNLDPGLDTKLTVYSAQGHQLGENDDYLFGSRASRVVIRAGVDGYFYARVTNQAGDDPIDKLYCLKVTEVVGTPTVTPTPTGTRVPGADVCEPNNTYDDACLIGPGDSLNLNFVPFVGEGTDTDIFRMWVKAGILYTCETFNLSPVNDTNMIFASGPSREQWFAGNDDKEPGDLGSELTFFANYTGWLYILVGPVAIPDYVNTADYTYSLACESVAATPTPLPTETPTPTATRPPSGGGNGGGGGFFPTSTPFRTPTPMPTPVEIIVTAPVPTPTAPPNIVIVPLPTAVPPPDAGGGGGVPFTVDVTLYYDANNNFMPELTEGIMDVAVALYDNGTGQLLSFGYTNEAGNVRFPLVADGPVRVVVPYLNFTQLIPAGDATIMLRVAPQPLPGDLP